MLLSTSCRNLARRFHLVLAAFLAKEDLPFADVLPEKEIQAAFDKEGVDFAQEEDAVYTPQVTLWAFLSQVLFKEEQRSCMAAVARVVTLMAALGRSVGGNTGAYCRARAKLPETVISSLTHDVAVGCEQAVPGRWLWHGHHVYLVDGTTVSMPDTEANQQEWPQSAAQKEGLGFPIARMVVLLSLATGMLINMSMGPYAGKETGETALFRQLLGDLRPGAIVLGDRYFCSYFMIALILTGGGEVVTRLHQRRTAEFSRGRRLGKNDHVVVWERPDRPEWMDEETYQNMPESITLREFLVNVEQPGFRPESFVVVTTLIDARKYTKSDVAELYHKRWLAELDIRAIKSNLGMDVLRCKSPEMVRKEIWTCLLAYNLIRKTILEAALRSRLSPRQLSFTTAMQITASVFGEAPLRNETALLLMVTTHLDNLATAIVGDRPDRVEPRENKRRPKPHRLLTKPREQARAELLGATSS